jgi:hypothetical protein
LPEENIYQNILDIGHISVFLRKYNIPIDSYSRLVIGYLIDNDVVSEENIINFGRKLGIPNLDRILILEALRLIAQKNIIYFKNDVYVKNHSAFYFKDIRGQSSELYNKMLDEIVKKIAEGVAIDEPSKVYIKSIIQGVFTRICQKRTMVIENIYRINGNSQFPLENKKDVIEEAIEKLSKKWAETNANIENQEKIDSLLHSIIKNEFLSPTKVFSQGFDIFYRGFLLIQGICLDPKQEIIKQFDYDIYLDTNIFVACSIKKLEEYNLMRHIVDKLDDLEKVTLTQTNLTVMELVNLFHATKMNLLSESSPLIEYANNEIYHAYERCYKQTTDVETFFNQMNKNIQDLKNEKLIEYDEINIDENKKTQKDYGQIELVIESSRKDRGTTDGSFAVIHDVNLLIEALKDPANKKIILTRSFRFYTAADYLKKKGIIKRNPIFHITHFIDFLSPFLSVNQPEDTSESIIKLISFGIIPERREIELVDYLTYVCQELLLPDKDAKKIIDKIFETHLKEELQEYLDQRNLAKLFPVLLTTIGNLVDDGNIAERHQAILERVIGKKIEKEITKLKEGLLENISDIVDDYSGKQRDQKEINYASIKNQLTAIQQIIIDAKHIIELEHGWKLLWEKNTHKNENEIQEVLYFLFKFLGKTKKIQVFREPDTGNGKIDFIFTGSFELQVYVEVKLSNNTQIKKAIESQIPMYYRAGLVENGYLLIIEISDLSKEFKDELEIIRDEINKKRGVDTDIVYIDGREQKTASKV